MHEAKLVGFSTRHFFYLIPVQISIAKFQSPFSNYSCYKCNFALSCVLPFISKENMSAIVVGFLCFEIEQNKTIRATNKTPKVRKSFLNTMSQLFSETTLQRSSQKYKQKGYLNDCQQRCWQRAGSAPKHESLRKSANRTAGLHYCHLYELLYCLPLETFRLAFQCVIHFVVTTRAHTTHAHAHAHPLKLSLSTNFSFPSYSTFSPCRQFPF